MEGAGLVFHRRIRTGIIPAQLLSGRERTEIAE